MMRMNLHILTLAAGSAIAGTFTRLGGASIVAIMQKAERRGKETISFLEFLRIGAPSTVINAFVYWVFLRFL
jgi:Na+/H+ antiporter NhaD/arsenite permease-like protein